MDRIVAAAQLIATSRRNRVGLKALPPDIAPRTRPKATACSARCTICCCRRPAPLVGYKIGCTSTVMQQYLDIPHPCGGGVFARGVHETGVRLRGGRFRPRRRRMRDRGAAGARLSRPGRRRSRPRASPAAIEAYLPAIEIVDDRYDEWETHGRADAGRR